MIEIRNLSLRQGAFKLTNINLSIAKGEHAVLMGSTGCGKTTLIETICGLRSVDQGQILIDGQDVTRIPPGARQTGYVPQDAALFPTMRVEQQIAFGLQVRKISRREKRERVQELADALAISNLLRRYPNRLSGGERQRVALARAVCFRPRLLCLDEPLSAIDHQTHEKLTEFLKTLHQAERMTILHITHNLNEAEHLGTRKLLMESGKIK